MSDAVFNIGRHRIESDGKGIRTLVIFSGCPLRCKYCLNKYTWDGTGKLVLDTPEDLLKAVSVDSVYFRATGGGITFGGGEPLLHADFISQFIDIAPKTWNYCIETSLAVPTDVIRRVADKIHTFVVDIKSMDESIYKSYTGGDLSLAKRNLSELINLVGVDRITVRVPEIPDFANKRSQRRSVSAIRNMGITRLDAFRYIKKS